MISPISLEKAYSDWQVVNPDINHQKEILGAFAEKVIVDDYDRILRESGFLPVAFEFPAFSLTRLVKELGPAIDMDKSYLLVNVSTDGLNFLITKKGNCISAIFFFGERSREKKGRLLPLILKILFPKKFKRLLISFPLILKNRWKG